MLSYSFTKVFFQLFNNPLFFIPFLKGKDEGRKLLKKQVNFIYFWLDFFFFTLVAFASSIVFIYFVYIEGYLSLSATSLILLGVATYLLFFNLIRYIQFIINRFLLGYVLRKSNIKIKNMEQLSELELFLGSMDTVIHFLFFFLLSLSLGWLVWSWRNWFSAGLFSFLYLGNLYLSIGVSMALGGAWYFLITYRNVQFIQALFPEINLFTYWLGFTFLRPLTSFCSILLYTTLFISLKGALVIAIAQ